MNVINYFSASVVQKAILIENRKKKLDKLDEVLEEHNVGEKDSVAKALIFGKTKKGVDFLALKLSEKLEEKCMTMHGDRSQEWVSVICLFILSQLSKPKKCQREIALWTFSTSNCPVLVATNVAARGLDIPAVDLIVNFDCSDECYFNDDYIHRIGRAGRVGRPGTAVTFIEKERDAGKAAILKKLMEVNLSSLKYSKL
jgi:superfamily II DNA/RNA helicase